MAVYANSFFSVLFFGYSLRVAYAKKMDFDEPKGVRKNKPTQFNMNGCC
jgi:hypothetical protein